MEHKIPLTDLQLAYFFGRNAAVDQKEIATSAFYEYENTLDIKRFEQAWNAEIQRQEMLRTVFTEDGNQIFRTEHPYVKIPVLDYSSLSEAEAEKKLVAVRNDFIEEKMPVESWPLYEVKAVLLPSGKKRLLLKCDMLISDAVGMRIFLNETLCIYLGEEALLPSPKASYRDFVLKEIQKKTSAKYEKDRQFWEKEMENFPRAPRLPVLDQRAKGDFSRFSYRIEESDWILLKGMAKKQDVVSAILFLAVYVDVLKRWNSNHEFTLNITTTDRKPEYRNVIGNFSALFLLPIRRNVSARDDFWDMAKALQKDFIRYYRHTGFNGLEVKRHIMRKNAGITEQLSFPVVYTSMLKNEETKQHVPSILGETVFSLSQTPQVYLDFQVHEMNHGVTLTWDFLKSAFVPGIAECMFGQFSRLLDSLLAQKETIYENVWDPDGRYENQIKAYNQTETEYPYLTLQGMVADCLRDRMSQDGVTGSDAGFQLKDASREYTGFEVRSRCEQIAGTLKTWHIGPGDVVAVEGVRTADAVMAIYGIIMAGASYVSLNPDDPPARKEEICGICGINAIFDGKDLILKKPGSGRPSEAVCPDDVAYCIFTSGTTGKPKGVMISQRGAANTIQDLTERYKMSGTDRFLLVSSYSFDLSVFDLFGSLFAGGSLYVSESAKNLFALRKICAKEQITIWNSVPAIWKLVLDGAREGTIFSQMRIVLISGDRIPQELVGKTKEICPNSRFISLGGATEASIWSILYETDEIREEYRGRIPYGYPMKNQTVYVLDEDLNLCYPEVEGEICIGGAGVAIGYKGDEKLTAEHFIVHPLYGRIYRTGDLGMFRREGYVDILGRMDKQVKVNGYRIELEEIEGCIKKYADVKDAVVVLQELSGRKQISAFVTLPEGREEFDSESLDRVIRDTLPEYMVPGNYYVLGELPLTLNKKIDRKLLEQYMPHKKEDSLEERMLPETPIEQRLYDLCKKALPENTGIDVSKSFFAMEVDSVRMLELMQKVNLEFCTNLSVQDFLGHTTIWKLAKLLEVREGDAEDDDDE